MRTRCSFQHRVETIREPIARCGWDSERSRFCLPETRRIGFELVDACVGAGEGLFQHVLPLTQGDDIRLFDLQITTEENRCPLAFRQLGLSLLIELEAVFHLTVRRRP